jgi:tetratricopeptide (TPR) repeat protein
MQEPDPGGSWTEREVLMTAHEGSDHAERAERRDIGDATLDQLRADVTRLSVESMTADPLSAFGEMRRVRSRIYNALDRQIWPQDAAQLYFLCGALSVLMAVAAEDLGYPQAAEELARAGWAYATVIDHRPLMAQLRLQLFSLAYWQDRPRQARDLAESGLRSLSDGPNAAQLHLKYGRAAARLGDTDAARRAVAAAHEARHRDYTDDLLDIGGEFGLSLATHHYFAGSVFAEAAGGEHDAITELEQAVSLYEGPGPGEQHGYAVVALAHVGLATARIRAGQLDSGAAALEAPSPSRRASGSTNLLNDSDPSASSLLILATAARRRPGNWMSGSRSSAATPSSAPCTICPQALADPPPGQSTYPAGCGVPTGVRQSICAVRAASAAWGSKISPQPRTAGTSASGHISRRSSRPLSASGQRDRNLAIRPTIRTCA